MDLFPLLLVLASLVGGVGLTLFVDRISLPVRLAAACALGLAWLGLAGFVAASCLGLGLNTLSLALTAVLGAAPGLALVNPRLRTRLRTSHGPAGQRRWTRWAEATALLLAGAGLLAVFDRAIILDRRGLTTGVEHNLGDLPFHLAVIMNFAEGGNFPPEHPELSGTPLTYPFLSDFVAALLVKAGSNWAQALHLQNGLLALALLLLLHHFALEWTGDRRAALLVPILVLASGGFGFVMFFGELSRMGIFESLGQLQHDYTILRSGALRWGNVVTTLLIPQRSLLMGLPLTVWIWTLWWRALSDAPRTGSDHAPGPPSCGLMVGAGVAAGLLPWVHVHSFATVVALALALACLFPDRRLWGPFFALAGLLALPQIVWMAHGSALQARQFIDWHVGWQRGNRNVLLFWLYNTGLFLPLLAAALAWRGPRPLLPPRLVRFYLPFALFFVAPNLLKLSPWIWDNIKFLLVWFTASTPLVALLLARLSRSGVWQSALAFVLLLALTVSGGLDLWRVASRQVDLGIIDARGLAFARGILATTPPGSRLVHLPTHNAPALVSGRRSVLGYPGHIWSQGLDEGSRQQDLEQIYEGGARASELLAAYSVDFLVLGPQEKAHYAVKRAFVESWPLVLERAPYRLYDVRPESRHRPALRERNPTP